jgi:hypothetical protein
VRESTRDRPWQILLTGKDIGQIDAATRQALEQILELFTEVGGLVVRTTAGRVSVTRDFQSDYTTQVDRLLGAIFKNNAAVTGIEFLGLENPHTATPDDPYWSPQGKVYASIERAAARGEITSQDAIAAYRRLVVA